MLVELATAGDLDAAASLPVALEGGFRSVYLPGIPYEMRAACRWGLWRYEQREGYSTKVPYSAVAGTRASATNLLDWTTFEIAAAHLLRRRKHDGLGFLLGDGFAGVDLDHCRNPLNSDITSWAASIVERLRSYTETSPSGTGLKVFIKGELPDGLKGRKRGQLGDFNGGSTGAIELYAADRYFTVTGWRYGY